VRRTGLCFVAALTGWCLLGCSGASTPIKPATVVVGSDYAFKMPGTLRAGWTTLTFVNQGIEPHQLQLVRLGDGVTPDQFRASLTASVASGGVAALRLGSPAGGVDTIAVAGIQRATVMLQTGNYVALCFVTDPDGVSHFAKGMVKFFTVTGPRSKATRPEASATIKALDFAIRIPTRFSGSGSVAFQNVGTEPHELALVKLNVGVTANQAKAALLAQPSITPPAQPLYGDAGGAGAIRGGATEYVNLKLAKGHYIAVCLVRDPTSGRSHLALGMLTAFTIS
jgi:hypothetical protein